MKIPQYVQIKLLKTKIQETMKKKNLKIPPLHRLNNVFNESTPFIKTIDVLH